MLKIRRQNPHDAEQIAAAFVEQGWKDKTARQYEQYYKWQEAGVRDVLIAEFKGAFAGYLTIVWSSTYAYFKEKGIPEIVDFNVLKKYQRLGIGTALMDAAENRIREVSTIVGIGVGLYTDYGPAQILYIKRGYIPDGNGISHSGETLPKGASVTVDDGLTLSFTKSLV